MFAGGIADKLGNRYEAKWTVRQLLDVFGAKADWICYEGISTNFRGFEFAVHRRGVTEWHQTKVNSPHGNWTLAALQREGVLSAFKQRLQGSTHDACIFVSQDPARDIRSLVEKATIAATISEYVATLGSGHTENFTELQRIWSVDAQTAFEWLKRSEFRTESQQSIESTISTLVDFYFFKAAIPFLHQPERDRLSSHILDLNPELQYASQIMRTARSDGKQRPTETAIYCLRRSGYDQWCILETIGENLLDSRLSARLSELRRKFKESNLANQTR